MNLGLAGRVALVTGASKGIGRGIARALAEEGARVAICSRSREQIEAAAAELGVLGLVHDTGELAAAGRLLDRVEAELGPLDVLVTNTGGPPFGDDALGFSHEQWEQAHRQLLLGTLALVERASPGMRARRFGRIVSVSSIAAVEPIPSLMLSNTYRSGLLGAFKTLARQLAGDGVTANTILPGSIETDRSLSRFSSREQASAYAETAIPARRMGTVEELAALAAFLCSEQAGYITGQAIRVDGGSTFSV